MTLFRHTEPPKESGRYFTDKGELYFNSNDKQWIWGGFPVEIKYWYSPSPPKEIDVILNRLKIVNGTLLAFGVRLVTPLVNPLTQPNNYYKNSETEIYETIISR